MKLYIEGLRKAGLPE